MGAMVSIISAALYFSFVMKGRGTVATGRVEQGVIKVGEEVEVLGLMQVCMFIESFPIYSCPLILPVNKLILIILSIKTLQINQKPFIKDKTSMYINFLQTNNKPVEIIPPK